nr:reverse transcriptase domain-containing protein [Tanacetum cinerariifolium]
MSLDPAFEQSFQSRVRSLSESEGSVEGHWKSKPKKQKSSVEDDLSQPWKKCIKDPVEIHNIIQRDGESTEEFVRRYKLEYRDVKGAPECMKIFGFMHGITNPELIKRLHDKIPKSKDEMMSVTTTFLRGEDSKANNYSNFLLEINNFFPTLGEEDGTEGLMIIEVEMGGHSMHRIYSDGGSSSEILKARGKEDPSNSIRGAWNNKILSGWRNSHIAEQQDHPTRMLNDTYKGYHQIKMANEDEEKTAFITSQGIFCYSKMSFGLKNAGATYQCLVDKAFQKHIGRNLEVYVDDLVIKSQTKKEVIREIEEMFKTLREINMKLNPKKYAFEIREGTFLGYKVDTDGLRVCLNKVEAVLSLSSPKCLKDVQNLNGKLASLNRFLSKSAEISLPFFKTLKKCTKKNDFQWTTEAEVAFKGKKQLIAELPMLTAPKEKRGVDYVSGSCKRSHQRSFDDRKGREANFIVERPKDDTPDTSMKDMEELLDPWILFTDGSSCIDNSRAGLIITNPEGMEFTYALRFRFNATNNEAEYEALIAGLWISGQMGV